MGASGIGQHLLIYTQCRFNKKAQAERLCDGLPDMCCEMKLFRCGI